MFLLSLEKLLALFEKSWQFKFAGTIFLCKLESNGAMIGTNDWSSVNLLTFSDHGNRWELKFE
jgi:hypothetical protein